MQQDLIAHLSLFVTPQRLKLFDRILLNRTKYITVVLEDIYQAQNASAVLRTCDCFGIQNVHIIENRNTFEVDREVAMGASKWLSLHTYQRESENTLHTLRQLKKQGYTIVATSPHGEGTSLHEFDISKGKLALVFGSELPGVTDTVLQNADEFLKIPMFGFTESFNISVSVAVILHHLSMKMRSNPDLNWHLTREEIDEIKLQWLRNSIKSSKSIEKRFGEGSANRIK